MQVQLVSKLEEYNLYKRRGSYTVQKKLEAMALKNDLVNQVDD